MFKGEACACLCRVMDGGFAVATSEIRQLVIRADLGQDEVCFKFSEVLVQEGNRVRLFPVFVDCAAVVHHFGLVETAPHKSTTLTLEAMESVLYALWGTPTIMTSHVLTSSSLLTNVESFTYSSE